MNLLLHNATLVDPFGPIGVVDKGYVLIEDDLIKAVGEGDAPEKGEDHIDLHGALLMPALINAHTHLYSALALGMPGPSAPPVTFQETLEKIWWKLDRALDKESTRASFRVGLAESLRAGTGTVIDHHSSQNWVEGSLEILAEAAGEIGARIGVAFEITDRNGSEVMEQELKETEWALRTCAGDPFVRPMIGLHASFTLEDSTLERVAQLKKQYPPFGIHIHLSEGPEDGADAKKRGYKSPLQRLDSFGLLGPESLLIHGVHCGGDDLALLRERGSMLVHNPTSNANNRVGLPAHELLSESAAGLGTDGMQADMLREAKEGTFVWSAKLAAGESSPDLIEMLLKNNPLIASRIFGQEIGHLVEGAVADLTVFEYDPRTPVTRKNISGHLLFGGLGCPKHVITGGRMSVRDGKLTGVDEEELYQSSRIEAERLWNAMRELD